MVGTPGRILDHIERGTINFSSVRSFILDEADRMLDLGFKDDVEKILDHVRKHNLNNMQICMFSATIPDWLLRIAQTHMRRDY